MTLCALLSVVLLSLFFLLCGFGHRRFHRSLLRPLHRRNIRIHLLAQILVLILIILIFLILIDGYLMYESLFLCSLQKRYDGEFVLILGFAHLEFQYLLQKLLLPLSLQRALALVLASPHNLTNI